MQQNSYSNLTNLLGRVEVQLDEGGPWGAVCGDGWGVREAMVSSKIKHLPTKMVLAVRSFMKSFLRLYGISYIFQLQKRIVVATIILGNTVDIFFFQP